MKMSYAKSVFIAFDQLINAVFGGWPDETLSSRAWRWHTDGVRSWPCKFIDALFFWQENYYHALNFDSGADRVSCGHCQASYISERNSRHLPPELRNKGVKLCPKNDGK